MKAPQVTVIDYGVGNLLSVQRGLEYCGAEVRLTSDPKQILDADRVVLPGVGAFPNAMEALLELNLIPVLQKLAKQDTPLLAICLGMQLLMEQSEEFGITAGLGLIPGRVVKIPNQTTSGSIQKTPHIGWNALKPSGKSQLWRESILRDSEPGVSTYFLHSYMTLVTDENNQVAHTVYGGHEISAVISKDRITGCQFHPEKSGEVGLKLLRNFILQ
jgi:imidazole glycerol-phosphate synthase subunit HisH